MAKFVFHGVEEGKAVRIDCGTMSTHGTVVIGPSIVEVDADCGKRQSFLIWGGKPFVIDESDHERGMHWVTRWMRSHVDFQLLGEHKRGTLAGPGNSY